MVFECNGLSYSDLSQMDVQEFEEAVAARNMWNEERKKAMRKK